MLPWLRYLKPETLALTLSLPDDDVGSKRGIYAVFPTTALRGVSVKNEQSDGRDSVAWSHSQMEMTYFHP